MTIVPVHDLAPAEISHLGSNLAEAVRQDHEAINRSLGTLGEALTPPPDTSAPEMLDPQVEAATRSEHIAS
jgi:hypothetical protein